MCVGSIEDELESDFENLLLFARSHVGRRRRTVTIAIRSVVEDEKKMTTILRSAKMWSGVSREDYVSEERSCIEVFGRFHTSSPERNYGSGVARSWTLVKREAIQLNTEASVFLGEMSSLSQ